MREEREANTWVVKLGGSLQDSVYLQPWLDAIVAHGSGRVVLVPGGQRANRRRFLNARNLTGTKLVHFFEIGFQLIIFTLNSFEFVGKFLKECLYFILIITSYRPVKLLIFDPERCVLHFLLML